MTYYRDLDPDQKEAMQSLLLLGIGRRISDETGYTNQVLRLSVISNGAGIALLATFMGAIFASESPDINLTGPLWKFLFGSIMAAFTYVPLMAVASNATTRAGENVAAFFQNQIEFESMKGYGLNRLGRNTVRALMLGSLTFFVWGVIQTMEILSLN
jgi:hypothetical protein